MGGCVASPAILLTHGDVRRNVASPLFVGQVRRGHQGWPARPPPSRQESRQILMRDTHEQAQL